MHIYGDNGLTLTILLRTSQSPILFPRPPSGTLSLTFHSNCSLLGHCVSHSIPATLFRDNDSPILLQRSSSGTPRLPFYSRGLLQRHRVYNFIPTAFFRDTGYPILFQLPYSWPKSPILLGRSLLRPVNFTFYSNVPLQYHLISHFNGKGLIHGHPDHTVCCRTSRNRAFAVKN